MEGIIIILIVWAFMKTTAIDVIHAAKGTPSPRWGPATERAKTRAHNSQQRATRRTARSRARSKRKAARTAPTFSQIAAEYARGLTHDSAQEVRARHAEKAKLRTERKGVKTQAKHEAKVDRIRSRPAAARPQWGASDITPQVLDTAPSPEPEETQEHPDRPTPQVKPRQRYAISIQAEEGGEWQHPEPTDSEEMFEDWRKHARAQKAEGRIHDYLLNGQPDEVEAEDTEPVNAEIVEEPEHSAAVAAHPASGASDGMSLDQMIEEVAQIHEGVSQLQINLEQTQVVLDEVEMKGAAVNALVQALHQVDAAEQELRGVVEIFGAQRTIQDRYRAAGEKETGNSAFYIGPTASSN